MNDINKLGLIYSLTNFLLAIIYAYAQAYSKRGYLLGVSLSETMGEDKRVRDILRTYKAQVLALGVISSIGIYLLSFVLGEASLSLVLVLATILVGLVPLVLQNKRLREISKADVNIPKTRVVSVEFAKQRLASKKKIFLPYGILFLVILAFAIKIHLAYPGYPEKLINHMDFSGKIDYTDKTYLGVQSVSIISLLMWASYLATNLAILRAKARISPDKPEESLTNLIKTRRLWTFYCLISSLLMVLVFQVGVADFMKTGKSFLTIFLTVVLVTFAVAFPLIIGRRYSVDGSRRGTYQNLGYEEDDKYWLLGASIYYNTGDPSFIVEKRVGVGYTINLGSRLGKIILVLGLLILIAVFVRLYLG